jgi:hypothetical protein
VGSALPGLVDQLAVTELLANVMRHVPDRSRTAVLLAEQGELRVGRGSHTRQAEPGKRVWFELKA